MKIAKYEMIWYDLVCCYFQSITHTHTRHDHESWNDIPKTIGTGWPIVHETKLHEFMSSGNAVIVGVNQYQKSVLSLRKVRWLNLDL